MDADFEERAKNYKAALERSMLRTYASRCVNGGKPDGADGNRAERRRNFALRAPRSARTRGMGWYGYGAGYGDGGWRRNMS